MCTPTRLTDAERAHLLALVRAGRPNSLRKSDGVRSSSASSSSTRKVCSVSPSTVGRNSRWVTRTRLPALANRYSTCSRVEVL